MRRIAIILVSISVAAAGMTLYQVVRSMGVSSDPIDRFSGGAFDGSASAIFSQSPDEAYTPLPRFFGGAKDGYGMNLYLVNEPMPRTSSPRFSGTAKDGYAFVRLNTLDEAWPPTPSARYAGGNTDGYSTVWLLQSGGGNDRLLARFAGGFGSGYDNAFLLRYAGGEIASNRRFHGGVQDGYANVVLFTSGIPIDWLSPRFFGGGGDGYMMSAFVIPAAVIVPDMDQDMIPDWWEDKYTGDPQGMDADAIADASGMTHLEKFIASCEPGDPNSIFCIEQILFSPAEDGSWLITWPTVPGRLYEVYGNNDLNAPWPDIPIYQFEGTGEMAIYPISDGYRFFRITVEMINE